MISYIDGHRERFGVEPICNTLQFRPFHLLRSQETFAVGSPAP